MSFQLLSPRAAATDPACPVSVINDAIRSQRSVIRIVWDDDDIPDHAKGYVQWSVRPYRVTDRCDGTRDSNAMLDALMCCGETHVDLAQVYADAYPNDHNIFRSSI